MKSNLLLSVWDVESDIGICFNIDGSMRSNSWRTPIVTAAYTQVFRNGGIEMVDMSILGAYRKKIFKGDLYELRVLEIVRRYIGLQKFLGIDAPFFIMVSLLGMKGYRIAHVKFDFTI